MQNELAATRADNVKKVGELIHGVKIAMLTTVGEDGRLFSRPMATQEVDFDGDLYFFTYDNSPKAQEIRHDSRVNVAYSNPSKQDYVSISGRAHILHDRAKMEQLWRPTFKAWFPQELETPNICLLKVETESAEYWDSPSGVVATTIALVRNTLTQESRPVGENKTVEL
ncbi:MAG: pyridoxamine 5'-phosphate oxidase family protein [Capsulimonadales bacterium]|nr:pyridoxamine 5'-phosphate oxidase family protein [Capsulimonadales bacterium]